MLEDTLNNKPIMQVARVRQPIAGGVINIEKGYLEKLGGFSFPDDRTAYWWLQDRINALFDENGEYWSRMKRMGQLDYVIGALKGMRSQPKTNFYWNANRLIVNLFDPEKDLHVNRLPTPPCLITLSFYPKKGDLTLVGTFRAQYTDAKGLGNLFSLAMLLQYVCEETTFKPAELYNVAQKPILKYHKTDAKAFLHFLMK